MFIVVVVYFAAKVLYRLRDVLLLMLVGGFIALLLNPIVNFLQRWHQTKRRGTAVFIVMLFAVVVFLGLAFAFGYPLVNSMTHLADNLPSYVNKAEHNKGWIGHLLHKYHIQHWLNKNSSKLISFAKGLSKPALALGEGAATLVLALVTLFAFIVLLLLEAPKMRRFGLSAVAPAKSAWISRVGLRSVQSGPRLHARQRGNLAHCRTRDLHHAAQPLGALCGALRTVGRPR